jgi:penicillin-binding protein 1A
MGIEVAGKTGTTQSNGDFWYVGFSPYYVGGIWVGNDNVQMKLSGDSGSNARLWSAIMTPIHQGLAPAKIERNPNLLSVQVCSQSGKIPTELCALDQRGSQVITEYFVPGTQPTETCDVHVKVEVCTESNMLKSPFCPGNLIAERVFIKRDPLYDPEVKASNYDARKLYQQVLEDRITFTLEELKQIYVGQVEFDENGQVKTVLGVPVADLAFSGLLTADYQYQVPTKICTYHTKWHYDEWLNNGENPGNQDGGNEENPNDDDSIEDIIDDIIEDIGNGNNNNNNNNNNSGSPLDDIIESIEN